MIFDVKSSNIMNRPIVVAVVLNFLKKME